MKEAQFDQLAAEGYNRIPVTLETFADLDTPLSIYLKLTLLRVEIYKNLNPGVKWKLIS